MHEWDIWIELLIYSELTDFAVGGRVRSSTREQHRHGQQGNSERNTHLHILLINRTLARQSTCHHLYDRLMR